MDKEQQNLFGINKEEAMLTKILQLLPEIIEKEFFDRSYCQLPMSRGYEKLLFFL